MTRKTKWIIAIAVVCLAGAGAYLTLTHLSAKIALSWFFEQAGLPVKVIDASWDIRLRDFLNGEIRRLDLNVKYLPTGTRVKISSPVRYLHKNGKWGIRLNPTAKLFNVPGIDIPEATGTVDIAFERPQANSPTDLGNAEISIHMHETHPLSFSESGIRIKTEHWNLDAEVDWDPMAEDEKERLIADATLRFQAVTIAPDTPSPAWNVSVDSLQIANDIYWLGTPPLPLQSQSELVVTGLTAVIGKSFIQEDRIRMTAESDIRGQELHNFQAKINLVFDRKSAPFDLDFALDYKQDHLAYALKAEGDLDSLVTERFSKWFAPTAPILRRASAKGKTALKLNGILRKSSFTADGNYTLKVNDAELPAQDLRIQNLMISLPLKFPTTPEWGNISVQDLFFHSIHFKNFSVHSRLSQDGLDVTTEDENEIDHPIQQYAWGGKIDVTDLYLRIPIDTNKSLELEAATSGGPFELAAIQKDLCLLPGKPLKGNLKFNYPRIEQSVQNGARSLHMMGRTDIEIFNGKARVEDAHLFFNERDPRLHTNIYWNDLDLYAMGEWANFGDMRGSIDGSLKDAWTSLTTIGPVPMKYDLTFRGRERGGKDMRFYGRAVDNIMQLVGISKSELPWYALAALSLSTTWRNLSPARAYYLGFRAKNDGEWTELTTFDPVPDESDEKPPCDPKNHYMLCGSGLIIPLQTHGVYPLLMRADAFQGWLSGRIEFFKERFKKEESSNESCTSPW